MRPRVPLSHVCQIGDLLLDTTKSCLLVRLHAESKSVLNIQASQRASFAVRRISHAAHDALADVPGGIRVCALAQLPWEPRQVNYTAREPFPDGTTAAGRVADSLSVLSLGDMHTVNTTDNTQ